MNKTIIDNETLNGWLDMNAKESVKLRGDVAGGMAQELIVSRELLETAKLLLVDFGQLVSSCEVEVSPTDAHMYDKWMEKYAALKEVNK